jgi:lipopolysaccharide transport system ATP-binding protein
MTVISARNITKTFKIYLNQSDRLKETFNLTRKKFHREFHALKDVSFDVPAGQSLGFIGVNGSGKSTLLQIISGVMTPSLGTMSTSGRIAALLELGAGFNGELSGIENVKFQCSLMGIPYEEQPDIVEQICQFAQIGDFVHAPVKTYSSGMYVRLAFAAAITVNPDILIIDEALAVGDIRFQNKCLRKIREFREQGKTLLFVSHDANAVKSLCDRAILLNSGELLYDGRPDDVVKYYSNLLAKKEGEELEPDMVHRSGNGKVRIKSVQMFNSHGAPVTTFIIAEPATIHITIEAFSDVPSPSIGFSFHDRLGNEVFGVNNFCLDYKLPDLKKGEVRTIAYKLVLDIGVNIYSVSASCHPMDSHLIENYDWVNDAFVFKMVPNPAYHFTGMARLTATVDSFK